ncbi:hypothetical protein ACIRVF_14515 [Kitasatospora sp. NPDC101157]|uniref:hypothetical protein n=1 Tax=Kitasatospora sp. NPDC101157 TaxID=3364098 RepID=UPI003825408E
MPPTAVTVLMCCASAGIGAAVLTVGGHLPAVGAPAAAAVGRVTGFLDYFAGVFTLLTLTGAVVGGLVATDRLVLTPRLRVAVQSVHRATAVAALGFLATHIAVKVMERHAAPQTAVLPFSGGATFAVGLGTIAADLLVLVAATGAVRGRFAGSRRPWLWRVLHATAYACWPIALAHGLAAGRPAHAWVVWSYGLCAAVVALALLVRALAFAGRRRTGARHRRAVKAHRPATQPFAALAHLSVPAPLGKARHAGKAARRPGQAARTVGPPGPPLSGFARPGGAQ